MTEALGILMALVGIEMAAARVLPSGHYWALAGLRLLETALCFGYWFGRGWSLADLGLTGPRAPRGLTAGAVFSASFGALVGLAELGGRLAWGWSLLRHIVPWGQATADLLVAGALAAPLFEELVFRGILYGALRRRLGPVTATLAVTLLFAAAHSFTAPIPWTQAIGGVLFCAAYEVSRSLWAPVIVHASGNLAIFLLPLWVR
jgi:membrane protease YdiL (CAAX protease family)